MNSIKHTSASTKKKVVLFVVVSAVSVLCVFGVYTRFYSHDTPPDRNKSSASTGKVDLNAASDEQRQAGSRQKQSTADSATTGESKTQSPEPIAVTITAFNQNGNQVQIRTLIQEVSDSGTCVLKLENDKDTVVTKSSDIQAQPSSSSCKGFDISTDELSPGIWKASITVTIGTQTGNAVGSLAVQ